MARRIVFVPSENPPFYKWYPVEFVWKGRLSLQNARLNAEVLKRQAEKDLKDRGVTRVIEISRAGSEFRDLSAFCLQVFIAPPRKKLPLEVVYQSAKVWSDMESDIIDLMTLELRGVKGSRKAKKDANVRRAGGASLVKFCLRVGEIQESFPLEPSDAFYNWLYILTLRQQGNQKLVERLLENIPGNDIQSIGFSDIFYKPKDKLGTRYSCQARAIAMFLGLIHSCKKEFEEIFPNTYATLLDYLKSDQAMQRFNKFVQVVYVNEKTSSCSQSSDAQISDTRTEPTDSGDETKKEPQKGSGRYRKGKLSKGGQGRLF